MAKNTKVITIDRKKYEIRLDAARSCEMFELIEESESTENEIKKMNVLFRMMDLLIIGGRDKVKENLNVDGLTSLEAVGKLFIKMMDAINADDKAKNSSGSRA